MKKLILLLVLASLISFSVGLTLGKKSKSEITNNIVMPCPEKYRYINTLLGCNEKTVLKKYEYVQFSKDLENYLNEEAKAHHIVKSSVFFRDLKSGPTFSINAQEDFIPASLLKVPLLISYLSLIEKDPSLLKQSTKYNAVIGAVTQELNGIEQLEQNKLYTIEELIDRMIIYSDNLAYGLLIKFLERNYPTQSVHEQTMKDLGLVNPVDVSQNIATVKGYASIFRQLYASSYLSPTMSEKALALLAHTNFDKGLVAGLPEGIQVAHKFGQREGLKDNLKQFHDCGIVYYPDNPYLLCVMTVGNDKNQLIEEIKSISMKVYEEVNSRRL